MLVDQSRDTCISNSEKEVEATACYVTAFLLSSYKAITNTLCQASLLLARNSKVQNQILKSISDRQQQVHQQLYNMCVVQQGHRNPVLTLNLLHNMPLG